MRRKDFDSATARVAKSKRDDASAEEDLRKKTALYDESQRDVQRRIQDIRDAEDDGIEGLYRFLEAEIAFHENCMNALQRLRSEWEPRYVKKKKAQESVSFVQLHADINLAKTGASSTAEDHRE